MNASLDEHSLALDLLDLALFGRGELLLKHWLVERLPSDVGLAKVTSLDDDLFGIVDVANKGDDAVKGQVVVEPTQGSVQLLEDEEVVLEAHQRRAGRR